MKRLLVLCVCAVFTFYPAGCRNETKAVEPAKKVKSFFPASLAGMWKSTDSQWTIVLSPEGTLSYAVIPRLGATIRPNQTTKIEMFDGTFTTFGVGDCPVDYDPVTGELSAVLYVEKLHSETGGVIEDGYMKDIFSGRVSNDGKLWNPDWMEFFDYGNGLTQPPDTTYMGQLPFEKVSK